MIVWRKSPWIKIRFVGSVTFKLSSLFSSSISFSFPRFCIGRQQQESRFFATLNWGLTWIDNHYKQNEIEWKCIQKQRKSTNKLLRWTFSCICAKERLFKYCACNWMHFSSGDGCKEGSHCKYHWKELLSPLDRCRETKISNPPFLHREWEKKAFSESFFYILLSKNICKS